MGNRIKTGVAYVVKLLPIAIELIEKYRGTDEKKDSPECAFPVGVYNAMRLSLGIIDRKCNCRVEVIPYLARHAFAVLAILKRMCKPFRKCLGISPSHTSCASIHLSGADGAIFFWKSPICTTSVLTSFLNS